MAEPNHVIDPHDPRFPWIMLREARKVIDAKATSLGWAGAPMADVEELMRGYSRNYANCTIYAPLLGTKIGEACEVHGDHLTLYKSLGASNSPIGFPVQDQKPMSDNRGQVNEFQKGVILSTPTTGTHELYGEIRTHYNLHNGPTGLIGYPTTGIKTLSDGVGQCAEFEHGRAIYWSPRSRASLVYGDIRAKWNSLGAEKSFLSYPISDETGMPSTGSRYNDFLGGMIYWSVPRGNVTLVHEGPLPDHIVMPTVSYNFPGGAAINGYSNTTVHQNGHVDFSSHFHASGALPYKYSMAYLIVDADNHAYAMSREGKVYGSLEPGPTDDNFANNNAYNITIETYWRSICAYAEPRWNAQVNVNVGSVIGSLVTAVLRVIQVLDSADGSGGGGGNSGTGGGDDDGGDD